MQERERARRDRPNDDIKQAEVKAKVRVYSLRHQRRRCLKLQRMLEEGKILTVPLSEQDLYQSFRDGHLNQELDEATYIHGYGKLSTGHHIGAFGPKFG